jgi:hypothetical protein
MRELLGSSPFSLSVVASCVRLQLRLLPSTGVTRLHQYYEPLRHPSQPSLSLTSCQLIHTAITAGTSRVASDPLLPACRRQYPGRSDGNLFARTFPSSSAFPESEAGRPLHYAFRGLLSVYSRYGLHAHRVAYATFYTEGFSSFVASAAASIATGWSEPVPGRDFSPAEDQRLFTAHSGKCVNQDLGVSFTIAGYDRLVWTNEERHS